MNRCRWTTALAALAIAASLTLVACGGDDDDDDTTNGAPDPTTALPTVVRGSPEPRPTSGISTTVSIDADGTTPEVDASASVPVGAEFVTQFVIDRVGGTYHGYQFDIAWNTDVLSYVRVENISPAGLTFCSPVVTPDDVRVVAFCANSQLEEQDFTGPVSRIFFRCDNAGESTLQLLTPGEGAGQRAALGTSVLRTTEEEGSVAHDLTMNDATVTCT